MKRLFLLIYMLLSYGLAVAEPLEDRLCAALEAGQVDEAADLIIKGAEMSTKGSSGRMPMECARDMEILKRVAAAVAAREEKGFDLKDLDLFKDKPYSQAPRPVPEKDVDLEALCEACNKGDIAVVRSLIEKGVDPNRECGMAETPLKWAAFRGHTPLVSYLVIKGADINFKPQYSHTALHDAIRGVKGPPLFGHPEECPKIAEMLLKAAANPEIPDALDHTAIMCAADEGNLDLVMLLARHGANVNARNQNGECALSLAQQKGHLEVARALTDLGAVETKEQEIVRAGTALLGELGVNVMKFRLLGEKRPNRYDVVITYVDTAQGGDKAKLGSLLFAVANLAEHFGFTLLALEAKPSVDQYNQRARVRVPFDNPNCAYDLIAEKGLKGKMSRKDLQRVKDWLSDWSVTRYDKTWLPNLQF